MCISIMIVDGYLMVGGSTASLHECINAIYISVYSKIKGSGLNEQKCGYILNVT